ncbi:MAG: A/G-specific adenine glycosylase [Phycisphaerales bacterium]|nr:MAG: A/G-specific adenine glycosylase [Phycisphaerales bacterium]
MSRSPLASGHREGLIPPAVRRAIRRKLLRWYDRNKRDLPWRRRAADPYAQWVAEIMLQQTRVETVIGYYERFIRSYPTLAALARARHGEVLKYWEGLGYYRRILHLHQAARALCEQNAVVPDTVEGLCRLPGIGEYTAAAIASIAFGRREPAVDGNVARVLARLFGVALDIRSPEGKRRLRSLAEQLIPRSRPGDFNQAWMDLGSSICTPKAPACHECPLNTNCEAFVARTVDHLPLRSSLKKVKQVRAVVGVFLNGGRMLLRRRPTGGLWSGLWEFPNAEVTDSCQEADLLQELALDCGMSLRDEPTQAALVEHRLTHRHITFFVYVASVGNRRSSTKPTFRWVTKQSMARLSISTAHRRIHSAAKSAIENAKPGHG